MRTFDRSYFADMGYSSYGPTGTVTVGNLTFGGGSQVRIQSMTNTDTSDVEATARQCIRLFDAGCELVRITVPGMKEVAAMERIRSRLISLGYTQPISADVHFLPKVAEALAGMVEKVRINPGNYAEKSRSSKEVYDPRNHEADLSASLEKVRPLAEACRKHGTAIRIGVNHGSLSARIMSQYGDTPEGMVVSAMEFALYMRELDFHQVIISLKSSHTPTMIRANRLLAATLQREGLHLPLHLGVTEAGDGKEGKIRSALGIGTLLAEGIGDTIRVSLTGDPVDEIPFAKKLAEISSEKGTIDKEHITRIIKYPFKTPPRRNRVPAGFGLVNYPLVAGDESPENHSTRPDLIPKDKNTFINPVTRELIRILPNMDDIGGEGVLVLKGQSYKDILKSYPSIEKSAPAVPVIITRDYSGYDEDKTLVMSSVELGGSLLDRCGDGLWIQHRGMSPQKLNELSFGILQASGLRISSAEIIACPSCGRTRFDIKGRLRQVKERFSHLKGLKIGVMGCIVNGPGEMAGADYGYVGSGPGKVTLYYGNRPVLKNIDEEAALEKLEKLIRDQGDWVDA
jgi:(E)-4-hydroxy-3-methylbut-2-enyl-diphosphate synthase